MNILLFSLQLLLSYLEHNLISHIYLFIHIDLMSTISSTLALEYFISRWHWQRSLLSLFRAEFRFPSYEDRDARVQSYPESWQYRIDAARSVTKLSALLVSICKERSTTISTSTTKTFLSLTRFWFDCLYTSNLTFLICF